VQAQRSIMRS